MKTETTPLEAVDLHRLVRAQCAKAIREYRAYRRIHPEAFQVWACSEKKGAALLARRITRLLGRPNNIAMPALGHDQSKPQNTKPI